MQDVVIQTEIHVFSEIPYFVDTAYLSNQTNQL